MLQGRVKWFDDAKGYGFIAPDSGGKDLFVHFSDVIATGRRSLSEGVRVEFEEQETDRGRAAKNVTQLDE